MTQAKCKDTISFSALALPFAVALMGLVELAFEAKDESSDDK